MYNGGRNPHRSVHTLTHSRALVARSHISHLRLKLYLGCLCNGALTWLNILPARLIQWQVVTSFNTILCCMLQVSRARLKHSSKGRWVLNIASLEASSLSTISTTMRVAWWKGTPPMPPTVKVRPMHVLWTISHTGRFKIWIFYGHARWVASILLFALGHGGSWD